MQYACLLSQVIGRAAELWRLLQQSTQPHTINDLQECGSVCFVDSIASSKLEEQAKGVHMMLRLLSNPACIAYTCHMPPDDIDVKDMQPTPLTPSMQCSGPHITHAISHTHISPPPCAPGGPPQRCVVAFPASVAAGECGVSRRGLLPARYTAHPRPYATPPSVDRIKATNQQLLSLICWFRPAADARLSKK